MTTQSKPRVLMEAHEGRIVSALFENGFLRYCAEAGTQVDVITPAADLPGFNERYGGPGITFHRARLQRGLPRLAAFERRLRGRLAARGKARRARAIWKLAGEPLAASEAKLERQLIATIQPNVVFTPHVSEGFGRCLIAAAARRGIPTVGNVMSWDNPYRPLMAWPQTLTCWSETTRTELAARCAHPADAITVVGAPQFDPYFGEGSELDREALCRLLGLDPTRPIIVFATLGQFRPFMDETGVFAAYLDALDRLDLPSRPQTVLRLHPLSRLPYFEKLLDGRDVVVSRYSGSLPGMMWAPTRGETVLAGNLLRHADVCVSPGSTMTIEAAIFDTPTIMPTFNPYTGEEYARFFDQVWLQGHFRSLIDDGLIPLARDASELASQLSVALANRAWFRDQRRALRASLLGPLDGASTRRLAGAVAGCAVRAGAQATA